VKRGRQVQQQQEQPGYHCAFSFSSYIGWRKRGLKRKRTRKRAEQIMRKKEQSRKK
jgi:hypothetical protein